MKMNMCSAWAVALFVGSSFQMVAMVASQGPSPSPAPSMQACGMWLTSMSGAANCAGTLDGVVGASVTGTTEGFGSVIGNDAHDVFYAWTADEEAVACAAAGMLHFDSCDSSFDTWLRIYDAATGDALASCDDCGACGTQSVLTAPTDESLVVGGEYLLLVEGFGNVTGDYVIVVTCEESSG